MTEGFPPGYLGTCVIAAAAAVCYLLSDRRMQEAVLPALVLLIAGMSTTASIPRYMMGTFTVVLAVCRFTDRRSKIFRYGILLFMAVLEVLMVRAWVFGMNPEMLI